MACIYPILKYPAKVKKKLHKDVMSVDRALSNIVEDMAENSPKITLQIGSELAATQ